MNYSPIELSILKTITYFDIFQYPLTTWECWQLLYDPARNVGAVDLNVVAKTLNNLKGKNILKVQNGFWQLAQVADYYWLRQERYRIFLSKFRRARRWVRLFTWLGSVRLIAIVNSLGYRNPEAGDDIDLLIITRAGKIWATRWWLTGLAKVLGLRPTIAHQSNGLCLSFYLSDDSLNMNRLMINNQDVYFHFWFPHMTVLFDDGVASDLVKQNQDWLNCFPNLELRFNPFWYRVNFITKTLRWLSGAITGWAWEKFCKRLQLNLLPSNLAAQANKDTSVVVTDQVLKFHQPDRRAYYYDEWQSRLAALNI